MTPLGECGAAVLVFASARRLRQMALARPPLITQPFSCPVPGLGAAGTLQVFRRVAGVFEGTSCIFLDNPGWNQVPVFQDSLQRNKETNNIQRTKKQTNNKGNNYKEAKKQTNEKQQKKRKHNNKLKNAKRNKQNSKNIAKAQTQEKTRQLCQSTTCECQT